MASNCEMSVVPTSAKPQHDAAQVHLSSRGSWPRVTPRAWGQCPSEKAKTGLTLTTKVPSNLTGTRAPSSRGQHTRHGDTKPHGSAAQRTAWRLNAQFNVQHGGSRKYGSSTASEAGTAQQRHSGRRGQARQADRSRAVAPHAVITVVRRGGSVTGAARRVARVSRETSRAPCESSRESSRPQKTGAPPLGTPITSSHDKAAPMPSRKCKSRSLDDTSQASQSRF